MLSVARLDPSARRLLVGDPEENAQLWDVATWKPIDNSAVAASNIATGHWSLDGELVATGFSDGVVTIRDGETFESIRTMVGATGTSNTWGGGTLLFSPDKSTLLTNFDGPGRLWDVARGEQIGLPFPSFTGTSGANAGDQLLLLTASEDSVLYWNLDMSTWAAAACRAAGSELTEGEWDQWGPRDTDPHDLCG